MGRVDTGTIAAEVIKSQGIWNGTDEEFIDKAVS